MNAAKSHQLGSLLEDEYFLFGVLNHLIDFGLHECRGVCHKWNDVCRRLPVKLKNVPAEKIDDVPLTFPHAASLSTQRLWFLNQPAEKFRVLSRLPNLKRLEFNLMTTPAFPADQLPTWFAALTQLDFLCFHNIAKFETHFFESVKQLTLLTRLEFRGEQQDGHFEKEPISQLVHLRELHISQSYLMGTKGELLFLPSPSLTRLEIVQRCRGTISAVDAAVPHMRYLKSLSLFLGSANTDMQNWTSLSSNSRLKELNIESWSFHPAFSDFDFIPVIGTMVHLTSLHMLTVALFKKHVWEAISVLENLKSLKLVARHWIEDSNGDPPCPIANLTKLTSLSLIGHGLGQDARRLTNLVELEFTQDQDSELLLQQSLPQLHRLERLAFREEKDLAPITISAFSLLKNLKSLSLRNSSCIEVGLFQSLASLPALTEFRYNGYLGHVVPHSFIHELTLLKQLHRLSFYGDGEKMPLVDLFAEGSFPRLMYLESNLMTFEKDKIQQLFTRFPCLRFFDDLPTV